MMYHVSRVFTYQVIMKTQFELSAFEMTRAFFYYLVKEGKIRDVPSKAGFEVRYNPLRVVVEVKPDSEQ